MRWIFLVFIGFIPLASFCQETYTISLIYDEDRGTKEFKALLKEEIDHLLGQRFDIVFDEKSMLTTASSSPGKVVEEAFDGPAEMIVSLGFVSSNALFARGNYDKPSIAGITLQRSDRENSGIDNFTYIQSPFSVEKDLKTFKSIYDFKHLGVFVEPEFIEEVGTLLKAYQTDFELQLVTISDDVNQDLSRLQESVDAIYFLPNLYESSEDEQKLIDGINAKGLASFSLLGKEDTEKGILASISSSDFVHTYARRIAIHVMKIIEGENPKNLPVQVYGIEDDFVINVKTMREIEVYPPLDVLSRASFIQLGIATGQRITLEGAIASALQNNLSIQASAKEVDLQNREIGIARSNFLPEVNANTNLARIDENTAELLKAANQVTPETEWDGNVGLTQLIFSEPAMANLTIQKLLSKAEQENLRAQQLDLTLDVCTAYLRYLQSKANVQIQNKNVETSLSNLNIAKTKAKIGSSSLADVYGFESQLALNKISLNNALTSFEQSKISFNQLLNRPLDEDFILEDVKLIDQVVFVTDERISENVNNEYDIRKFSEFLINHALEYAPEIKRIDLLLMAQERSLKSNKRSIFLPQVALQGTVDKTLGRYGIRVPDETLEAIGFDPYNPTWNVGANASIPLFQGNERNIKIQRDRITIEQLETNKQDIELAFASNIRLSIENLGNSYNNILYTRQAEASSDEFLKIIQDLYREGAANIATLLDAQNNAVSAQLNAVSSRYQFLIDALTIERLINKMYLLSSEQEKDAFINNYFNYLVKKN